MAILNSIRKKTAVLIIIIALALFAFVLSDLISNSSFSQPKVVDKIGQVGDKEIERAEFAQNVEVYIRQTQGRATTMQAVKAVWDNKVQELALEEEYETLGIKVGRDQILDRIAEIYSGNPNFSNDEGFFDEEVMTEFLANLKATQPQAFENWKLEEARIANQIKRDIYINLIKAGVGVTQMEAKLNYKLDSDNVTFQVVRIPFDKATDVEVSTSDINSYIKDNPEKFEQEAQRDIQYVLFENKASKEDEEQVEQNIRDLLEEFRNTEDAISFINNNSDEPYKADFKFKNQLPEEKRSELLALEIGGVYGPYKENNAWKATKFLETKMMADSVKASHILISNRGPQALETPEQSKKLADSLFEVVKSNPSKLSELAKEFSADPGSGSKGGDLGWNPYGTFVPSFNEAVFNNQPGYVGLVESQFGYHIVKVEDLSGKSKMYKFADLVLNIRPSEETLNTVYRDAGNFFLEAQKGEFTEVAESKNYEVKPVLGIKQLDENIPGIGAQRKIVNWAFSEEQSVGDIIQEEIDQGYVVVQLNNKIKKGLQSAQQASAIVTPIIEKEKKAEAILSQINSDDLNAIATQYGVTVQNVNAVNMANPLIPGAGREPKVVGAAFALEKGQISQPIVGEKGVYVIKLTNRVDAPDLPSYKNAALKETQTKIQKLQNPNNAVVKALKDAKEIEDNRALVY